MDDDLVLYDDEKRDMRIFYHSTKAPGLNLWGHCA